MALADFKNAIITEDKFSQTFNKFDRSVQTSARGLDKLGGVLTGGGVGMLFGATAGVAGAIAIGKATFALGELGAQSLTTAASFDSLMRSVGQSPMLLDQLKDAAGGTVTELQLMQQANVALAGSSGQLATEMAAALPKLLEAGRAAAMLNPAMGDASFMFQSLVTGIKRGSPMLIDNTGITLKLGEATEAYAASIGKSVNELTAQERSIAILRATLESSGVLIKQVGGDLNSMTSDIQRSKVAVEELKIAFGELVAPTVAGVAGELATGFDYLRASLTGDELAKAKAELADLQETAASLAASDLPDWLKVVVYGATDFTAAIAQADAKLQAIQAPIQNAQRLTLEYGTSAVVAANNIGALTFSLRQAKEAAQGLGGAMGGLPKEYKAGLNTAFGQVYGMGSTVPAADADRIYSQYARQYAQLELDRTSISRAEYTRRKADLDAALSDQLGSYRQTFSAISSAASDTGDDIKSRIGSALRPTFDLSGLTGGALGGQMGDTFDEAYKRLAAVALRPEELQIHAGDWADTFEQAGLTGLTPEEAQQRARELVEAYSKGLDFSLIDREKIKDSVRQAIKAEEIYNTIVDEIYAEMGKENPRVQSAGGRIGAQVNKGMITEAKSGAKEVAYAYMDVMVPELIRRLDMRSRRAGD